MSESNHMSENNLDSQTHVILGQKYAYATISLILGITCFISLAGMEKAILAIVFAWMALKSSPAPVLKDRRVWAQTGLVLGTIMLIVVPTIILLNLDRLRTLIEALVRLSNGK
ncbi:MAG: hypothetical protein QOH51_150 [Acidobacteriota bacterium]|jgi:hypothetical protein|nr:hypothetical protein [Acidobacteriota bacterium]